MNQDTLTRLDWVIEAVEKAPPRQFNRDFWQHKRWLCGTTYCAIGWACQDERVQATGLFLDGARNYRVPRFEGKTEFSAVATWLDIPEGDARQLFGNNLHVANTREDVLRHLKAYRDQVQHDIEARREHRMQEVNEVFDRITASGKAAELSE